ncbi:MAG: hypothetical protein ACRCTF_02570 [Bacteroidales bacterium]
MIGNLTGYEGIYIILTIILIGIVLTNNDVWNNFAIKTKLTLRLIIALVFIIGFVACI